MSWIIEQIEDNAILHLAVSEEDNGELVEDYIEEFIDALSTNFSIRKICFEDEFLGCLRGNDRSNLIQTISRIPTLQEVRMNRSLVMVKDISALIANAAQLKVLTMNYIVFQGVESDHEDCEKTLYQHCTLREFELNHCSAAAVKNVSLQRLEKAGRHFQAMLKDASNHAIRPYPVFVSPLFVSQI